MYKHFRDKQKACLAQVI